MRAHQVIHVDSITCFDHLSNRLPYLPIHLFKKILFHEDTVSMIINLCIESLFASSIYLRTPCMQVLFDGN